MTDATRNLIIKLYSHMTYMQGQLEAHHELDDLEDYYWYRESVALRQQVADALAADGPAVPTERQLLQLAAEFWPEGCEPAQATRFARAALARFGHQPAPPAGELLKEAAWLRNECSAENGNWISMTIDQALDLASLLERQAAPVPVPAAVGEAAHIRRMCDIILGSEFGNEGLDSLALLVGHHPDVLNASPVPAEGEVEELVAELRSTASGWESHSYPQNAALITRAADLLEQRHPTPVPMSERLPGPEDCDAEGRCWWGEPQIGDSHDATWNLCTQDEAEDYCTWGTKCGWLPFTALPLPAFWDGDCDKTATSANQ